MRESAKSSQIFCLPFYFLFFAKRARKRQNAISPSTRGCEWKKIDPSSFQPHGKRDCVKWKSEKVTKCRSHDVRFSSCIPGDQFSKFFPIIRSLSLLYRCFQMFWTLISCHNYKLRRLSLQPLTTARTYLTLCGPSPIRSFIYSVLQHQIAEKTNENGGRQSDEVTFNVISCEMSFFECTEVCFLFQLHSLSNDSILVWLCAS